MEKDPLNVFDKESYKYKKSPFVDYKMGEEKFTMHYNNTQLLVVGTGEAELNCVCFWDKDDNPDGDPLLFFDPPYMDFLKSQGFPIREIDDEDFVDYIREKYHEIEIEKLNEDLDQWDEFES